MEGELVKGGIAVLERGEVAGLVIRLMVLPAADEDPLPFEGEGAGDGVVFLAA